MGARGHYGATQTRSLPRGEAHGGALRAGHVLAGRELFERPATVSDAVWRRHFGVFLTAGMPTWAVGDELGAARRDVEFARQMWGREMPGPGRVERHAAVGEELGMIEKVIARAKSEGLAVVAWVDVRQG